jgi:rhamnogalacturonyl hydrolase YesR
MPFWDTKGKAPQNLGDWRASIRLACRWATERSMVRCAQPDLEGSAFGHLDRYVDWRGAFLGEYSAAARRWDVYAPIWHGGQGVKGLAYASRALGDQELLVEAEYAADFLLRHQVADPDDEDVGLFLAYENDAINTTAVLETLDGLLVLSEISGEPRYADAAVAAARWTIRKAYKPEEGRFRETYSPQTRAFAAPARLPSGHLKNGAPMLDDGVFVKMHQLTGEREFLDVAVRVAERLLNDEDPPGNWALYPPNDALTRTCHPRTAYWWGRPMWMVGKATGDDRFVACARRAAAWYAGAMRLDGGLFRSTGPDFRTPSFGHATSGIACAAILWLELAQEFGDTEWDEHLARALQYCYAVQFTDAGDENLQGAILEKVMPPEGSDAPPWYLRDLGTFFYLQAVSRVMTERAHVLEHSVTPAQAHGA